MTRFSISVKLVRDLVLAPVWFVLAGLVWLVGLIPDKWYL